MKQKLIDFLNKDNIIVDGWSVETNSTHYGSLYTISIDARKAKEIECETCQGIGTIDETLGGEYFSNPKAECPDCDGHGIIEINERENMLTLPLPLEVGKKYVSRESEVVEIIKYDSNPYTAFPYLGDNNTWYTEQGLEFNNETNSDDLISDYIEESTITYDKKELLQAIVNEETLQFRVDENEKWQDVADNDWVLRMIADKSKFCFRVKPNNFYRWLQPSSFGQWIEFYEKPRYGDSIKIHYDGQTENMIFAEAVNWEKE